MVSFYSLTTILDLDGGGGWSNEGCANVFVFRLTFTILTSNTSANPIFFFANKTHHYQTPFETAKEYAVSFQNSHNGDQHSSASRK